MSQVLGGGGAGIKSVQRGSITVAGTATSGTATITAVDTANAVLRFSGQNSNSSTGMASANPTDYQFTITLTNTTTITAVRTGNGNVGTMTIYFEITEYLPGVLRSVTYGSVTINNPSTSGDLTISVTDITKTQISFLGIRSDANTAYTMAQVMAAASIISTTVARVTVGAASINSTSQLCVSEFY